MIATRWQTKPPLGYPIDWTHPLTEGLVSFWAFNEGTGLPNDIASAIGPRPITPGIAASNIWTAGANGPIYNTQQTPTSGRSSLTFGNCPDLAGSNILFSVAWGGTVPASTGGVQMLLDLYGTTSTGQLQLYTAGGAGLGILSNNGVHQSQLSSANGFFDGNRHAWGASLGSTAANGMSLYRDGTRWGSMTVAYPPTLPTATTGWLFCSQSTSGPGNSSPWIGRMEYFALWYRPLSADEQASFAANPWQIFRPRRTTAAVYLGTPDFTISPNPIPASRPGGVALALVGQASVNWSAGTTTLTPSGIAGDTLSGLSVTDSTHATVNVVTGSTAGALTLTDNNGNRGTVQVVTAVVTPSPATIPADHAGHLTINLTSNVGVWTTGSTTTFSLVSPPTGTTLVSQSVASPTSASIVVTTGTGTGTLTISDGFETATAAVVQPTLAVAAPLGGTTVTATGTYTITLTSTNTLWTQENASSLFTVVGGSGSTLSSIHVATDTSATATLDAGTAPGTLTITDTSSGMTAALTVAAVPSGSLHVTGPLMLAHTGGTPGIVGSKNAAAIAFFFRPNSNAGINLTTGTTILNWTTEPGGGPFPLAAFFPAVAGGTSTLKFALYGGTGGPSFIATVPVELGVGCHYLLTWSVAPAASVTGNVIAGSNMLAVTSGSLQVGDLIAGTGIPTSQVTKVYGPGVYSLNNNANTTGTGVTFTVTRGTQTLYVNGVSYATANVPYSTFAYSQIQVGGLAGVDGGGNPVVTDHHIANLAIWGSAAATAIPTAADAAGLAAGTLTPLDTSTPAQAWWPLGGGTTGSTPTLADTWLSDLTLNGNTLSVATTVPAGSLSDAAYAAAVTIGSPLLVGVSVTKCGKVLYAGTSLAPTINGAHMGAPLTAINANPTVHVNGSAVALSGPASTPNDGATAAWLLECGSVDRIIVADGGSGYVFPSASASGGGGSGLTLGTPTLATGVVGYQVIAGGSGYNSSPLVAIIDQAGSGNGATAIAMVNSLGKVAQVNVTAGGSNYTSPAIAIADGWGESLSVSVSGGAITAITVGASGGTGYTNGMAAVAIVDSTGSGALAYATVANGAIASVTVVAGGSGYSNNPTIVVYQYGAAYGSGQATATATASGGVVTGAVMTNLGSGYGVPPSVIVEQPPNWQGATGGIFAATCVHVSNGAIDAVYPMAGGLLGCGSGYSAAQPPFVLVGGGLRNANGGLAVQSMVAINLTPTSIASVTVNHGGTGYSSSPNVTLSGGGVVGTPTISTTVTGGVITAITVTGSATFTSAPTVTITDTTGSGAVATANLTGTSIASVTVPGSQGPGNFNSTPLLTFADPSGSATGAAGTVTLSGKQVQSIAFSSGGTGYTAPSMTFTAGTVAASIRPIVASYILSVPVTAGGTGYTSLPTIAVSDPAGTGAIFRPIMDGVGSSDVVTYSAPASWLTATDGGLPVGGVQAVSGAAVSNWTGQFEGATGGLWPIAVTPTMLAGADVGSDPCTNSSDVGLYRNMLHQGQGPATNKSAWIYVLSTTGTITYLAESGTQLATTPQSWTVSSNGNTAAIGFTFYGPGSGAIDTMGQGNHVGQWTLQYTDPNLNTPSATACWIYSGYGVSNYTVVPISLSGPAPAQVPAANITYTGPYNGQYITSINYTTTGAGYQAAGVLITNADGTPCPAAAVATVVNGDITGITVVSAGQNFNSGTPPIVTVYGMAKSGNTVTSAWEVAYNANPYKWQLNLNVALAQGSQQYLIADLEVMPPDSSNGNLAYGPKTPNNFAARPDVLKFLTASNGRTPGVLRWMDVVQGFGGFSNFVDDADLDAARLPTNTVWGTNVLRTATFAYARYLNTDPSQTQYKQADGTPYVSTKVYGAMGFMVSGVDSSFTDYGGVTSSGTPYVSLPPSDNGAFLTGGGIGVGLEFRSIQPHGFKSGQWINVNAVSYYLVATVTSGGSGYTSAPTVTITSNSTTGSFVSAFATIAGGQVTGITVVGSCSYASGDTVSISLSGGGYTTAATASIALQNDFYVPTDSGRYLTQVNFPSKDWIAWVTGPYTIAAQMYVQGYVPTSIQTVLSEVEIPISVTFSTQVPMSGKPVPYEFAASFHNQLGDTPFWCNLSPIGSDNLYQGIARRVAANIGSISPVWLEYGNENWNGGALHQQITPLVSYVPDGTPCLTYAVGNGTQQTQVQALCAGHAFKVFEDAWTANGQDASRLSRIYGSFWNWWSITAETLQTTQQWGIPGADYVDVAPYMNLPSAASVIRCFSPAGSWGSTVGGAASWPMDAINDVMRLWMAYSTYNHGLWQGHQQACQSYGQPLTSLWMDAVNATASAVLSPTSIAAVAVVQQGTGYTSPPTVILVGGGGTYTSATATLGPVVTVTGGGTGYASAPTVTLSGGGGTYTTAYATLSGTSVASVTVLGASGYTSAPTVTLTGGGYTTAATLTVALGVSAVTVVGSSGYTTAPLVFLQGGGPGSMTDAWAVAVLTPTSVGSFVMTSPGTGYNASIIPLVTCSTPTVGAPTGVTATAAIVNGSVASVTVAGSVNPTIAPTVSFSGGGGSGAAAVAAVIDNVLEVIVTSPGTGYTAAPTVTLSFGSGAAVNYQDITISGGGVAGIGLAHGSGGSGYVGPPAVTISGGGALPVGNYYAAQTFLDSLGRETTIGLSRSNQSGASGPWLAGISVQTPGAGYTSVPTVTVANGTAAAIMGVSVAMGAGGTYTTAPTVTLTGGGGTYTSATATLSGSTVTGVTVNGATGYTSPPTVSFSGGGGSGASATATLVVADAVVLVSGSYATPPTITFSGGGGTTQATGTAVMGGTSIPAFTMPPWPSWAVQMNVYLTQPNGAAGAEMLYMSIPAASYGTGKTYPINGPVGLPNATWLGATTPPPATNLAAANVTQPLPRMVCYEGGVTTAVPPEVPFQYQLLHDSFSHPSFRDAVWTWYSWCQTGCQTVGPGAAGANYFSMYSVISYPNMWVLSNGDMQVPGAGTSNKFATPQGGVAFDGHDHLGGASPNQTTGLQGLIDWFGATAPVPISPTPTPTPTSTRRWFSGLRRPVMRLGS